MVIAACSFALSIDPVERRVGTGIGSAGPTPLVASEARGVPRGSARGSRRLWEDPGRLNDTASTRFGELVASAARPIDDVRSTAAYRLHALGVRLALERALSWSGMEGALGAARLHGQPRAARDRRRLGGREPSLRAARAYGPTGLEERLRAGRVRFVLGVPRRDARLRLSRGRGPGRRLRDRDGGGPRARATASCTRSSRRSSTPAPFSAGSAPWPDRGDADLLDATPRRARPRSARRSRATSAAALATRRSSTPFERQRTAGSP